MEENSQGIPVIVHMAALVSYNGVADDPIQVMTQGTLYHQGEHYLLNYTESQEDEATGEVADAEIQLVLKKGQVTMNRMGDYANTMMFMKNKRFETVYYTPFGELPMAVYAREVRCELGESEGKVHLRYELSMQGAYASTNEMSLEYWASSR